MIHIYDLADNDNPEALCNCHGKSMRDNYQDSLVAYRLNMNSLSTEFLREVAKGIEDDPLLMNYPEKLKHFLIDRYEVICEVLRERENDSSSETAHSRDLRMHLHSDDCGGPGPVHH